MHKESPLISASSGDFVKKNLQKLGKRKQDLNTKGEVIRKHVVIDSTTDNFTQLYPSASALSCCVGIALFYFGNFQS